MKRLLITAAMIAFGAAAFMPAHARSHVDVNIAIGHPPPPVRYEVIPAARRGHAWAPGYWGWNGKRHVWVRGHWERARAGHYYQRPEWRQGRDGWRMTRGEWQRGGPRGDRDHDGVSNRRDRDRDGDGVPNRHDQRPDNLRRY